VFSLFDTYKTSKVFYWVVPAKAAGEYLAFALPQNEVRPTQGQH